MAKFQTVLCNVLKVLASVVFLIAISILRQRGSDVFHNTPLTIHQAHTNMEYPQHELTQDSTEGSKMNRLHGFNSSHRTDIQTYSFTAGNRTRMFYKFDFKADEMSSVVKLWRKGSKQKGWRPIDIMEMVRFYRFDCVLLL